jgi:Immunity protein family (Imm11)
LPYYQINTLGDEQDRELVFISREPEDLNGYGFRLAEGDATGDVYPPDARIYLDRYDPGLKLTALLGNSIGFLIVSTACKEVIARHDTGAELRPVAIYNQRGRLHSRDYWIVNPLRFVGCVNRAASAIQYSADDPEDIVGIDELVFDPRKLEGAPDLFRIPEQRMGYFASARLLQALLEVRPDNLYVDEIREQE